MLEPRRVNRRNLTLAALLVVLAVAMVLLVTLILRLRIDRVPQAMTAFDAARSEVQGAQAAVRSMKAQGQHLDNLLRMGCALGAEQAAYRARIEEVRRDIGAYAAAPVAPGADTLLTRIEAGLAEADQAEHACFRRTMDGIWAQALLTKQQAEALLFLIAFTVVAILLLRRSDQAQLRDQLRFNEQLIDAIPLPLSLRSPQGDFMLVNRAFEQKHGVSREHVLGKPVRDALPQADADAIGQMDARAAASMEPAEEHFHVVDERGDRHVFVRVHALRRSDASVIGIVGIQTDVTTLRRKEAQLTEINAKLSQLSIKMLGAQEDERRRIARDLHDQVGQILTALKLQLASLARRPSIDAPAQAFGTAIDLAEEALRHTRDLSASLHPHLLDDLGIEPALNWLIDRFIRPSVPQIELRCRLQPARGPEASELVAFRVVQEALTNVVRHAGATRVGVMLESDNGELTIEVIDDGVGFEAGASWFDLQRSASLGVTGMRDRVTEIGGNLHMDSHPGSGTSVRVHLPW